MAFAFTKTRYSPIAIDFGADSLKLLQVIPTNPPQLVAAAAAELSDEARKSSESRQAFFANTLPSLLKSQPFKGRNAICSIPAYQTLTQHIQIARVEHEDFDAQIGLHLRQRLNVDPSRMIIRSFEITQVVRDNASKQEVIILAASRDCVMRHVEMARRSKLEMVGIQCEPLAIIRAFEHLFQGEEAQRTICFIDLGSASTKVVIAHGPQMVFAKTINAAGDHLTRHHATARNITFMQARSARMQEALGPAGADHTAAVPEPVMAGAELVAAPSSGGHTAMAALDARAVSERGKDAMPRTPSPEASAPGAAADTLDCVIDELQLSVRYHQSLFPGKPIEKLVFLGGEARHVSTCHKIARALRIGAQLGDPLARLNRKAHSGKTPGVDLDQPQPGWAVPMGLCLMEGDL